MTLYRKTAPVDARRHTGSASLVIDTLEGPLIAQPGDWILTGPEGEQWPCRDDIFRQTYEPMAAKGEAKRSPPLS